jgi:hypothetical protein
LQKGSKLLSYAYRVPTYLPNLIVFEAGLGKLELFLLAESFIRHPDPHHLVLSVGHGIFSPYCALKNVFFFIPLPRYEELENGVPRFFVCCILSGLDDVYLALLVLPSLLRFV